ncbi:hypothetical protein EV178_000479 [Coemansia sp. RSA 1646]|nr:hypothetical protein EV178_000479 [Coemansia sp. RSA 1646]
MSALLQSRRWKEVPPMPRQPVPTIDLESLMKAGTSARIHNPLLDLQNKESVVEMSRRDAEAKEIDNILSKHGNTFPLSPIDHYSVERKKFLSLHHGIDKTPTRVFHGVEDPGETLNLKPAFGDVAVFRKSIHTGIVQKRESRIFPNEFLFAKPKNTYEYYLKHLTLYVHALHMLRETDKRTFTSYLDDFFLIIKAIRQRPAFHAKLVGMFEYKKLVLCYLLFDRQHHLALMLAINVFPNVVPDMLDRWLVTGVMELYTFQEVNTANLKILESYRQAVQEYSHNREKLERMSKVKKRRENLVPGPIAMKEIRIEALVSTIIEYYQSDKNIVMSAWELTQLIRLAKRRLKSHGLMILIPLVLKYFYQYDAKMYSAENKTMFFYDWWIWKYKIEGFQMAMYYIKSFVDIGEYEKAQSIAETIKSMPPKPIKGLTGSSRDIACALKGLLVDERGLSDLLLVVFDGFGTVHIKKSNKADQGKPKYAKLRLMLAEHVVKSAKTRDDKSADAATAMLGSLTCRMQSLTVMAIIRRLDGVNVSLAIGWITRNYYGFDKEAQKSAFAWLTENLVKNRNGCVHFIQDYSFKDPVTVSRLVHLISRQLAGKESDRKYILDAAQKHILSTGNAKAIGSLLITASQGPEMPVLSSFGPQSPTACARMVTRFIKSIKQTPDMDIPALVPFLFKVAQLLNSRKMEQMLWKEVLRHGIDVDQQILKLSLGVRLGQGDRNKDTLELLYHALCLKANFEESGQTEQPLLTSGADSSHFGSGSLAALYMTILNGANHAGAYDAVELLANFMLNSGELSNRSFGSLASIWLDSTGFSKSSSRDDVQRVWNALGSYVGPKAAAASNREEYCLNRNHYHSVIEALIRQGDVEGAWNMIQVELRKALIKPDLKTFYTLTSPLASNSQLWSIGKTMVQRFAMHYPEIVKEALQDRSNTPIVQALLRMSLKEADGATLSNTAHIK